MLNHHWRWEIKRNISPLLEYFRWLLHLQNHGFITTATTKEKMALDTQIVIYN